jgi:thymidine phosphorylase
MTTLVHGAGSNLLRLRRLGIDTYQEPVIYMSVECPVCRSEGWNAQTRVIVALQDRSIIATLNVVAPSMLAPDEASLSESAWTTLGATEGVTVTLSHAPPLISFSLVRRKLYGERLRKEDFDSIIGDISTGRYSDIEIAAFVAGSAGGRLDFSETVALTQAMIDAGERLSWESDVVLDKHSVGGLPGNRTTMLVVPIVAAAGLTIPKTSSRAITSPAGTADAMEVIAPVELDIKSIRRVVGLEGGCIAWGGFVRLSPADDVIIRVERPLDIDSEGQLVASILSKKAAAGSTHVVIDMPVGPTAKIRSIETAESLRAIMQAAGKEIGLNIDVLVGDGSQPVGRGIGPALEARDVLSVLRRDTGAPMDLRARALQLAGRLIEIGRGLSEGAGQPIARELLDSGKALSKLEAICAAQGGMREPAVAPYQHVVEAARTGYLSAIDNRRLARLAKLAGAPFSKSAGLEIHVRLGDKVEAGAPLYTLHAESHGELEYATLFATQNTDILQWRDAER